MKCAQCDSVGFHRNDQSICKKHYRIRYMIDSCRRDGKKRPSRNHLEKLWNSLKGFKCPSCKRKMIQKTTGNSSRSRVVTLQHDHSGEIRLICLQCNSRHKNYKRDLFYKINTDEKKCGKCQIVKKLTEFYNASGRYYGGKACTCKNCFKIYYS